MALTTHPHLAPRLKPEKAIFLLPVWTFVACSTVNFKLTFNLNTDYASRTVITVVDSVQMESRYGHSASGHPIRYRWKAVTVSVPPVTQFGTDGKPLRSQCLRSPNSVQMESRYGHSASGHPIRYRWKAVTVTVPPVTQFGTDGKPLRSQCLRSPNSPHSAHCVVLVSLYCSTRIFCLPVCYPKI